MPCLKFPCRTFFFVFAFFNDPTVIFAALNLAVAPLVDGQKIELTFDMDWNGSPSLFVTLYSFQRNPQQFGKGFLGLFQFRPQFDKYFSIHSSLPIQGSHIALVGDFGDIKSASRSV